MTAIAEFAPRARHRFLFDRAEVLGPLFIAPAILYVFAVRETELRYFDRDGRNTQRP